MRLTRGHGATDVDQGDPLRTQSQSTTQGACFPDKKGVICRVGEIKPGDTVRISFASRSSTPTSRSWRSRRPPSPTSRRPSTPGDTNNHAEVVTSVRAPITADGIPDGCASKPFTVKVLVDVPKADQTKAILDGKTIDTSSKSSFKFKVKPKKLAKGKHALKIVVQAKKGGPLATLKRKFKTCLTRHAGAIRAALAVLGIVQLINGLYALGAPRSFYDDFPLGRGWVEALPAYNEHLVRDVGGLFIATAVVLLAAARSLERRLVVVACVSFLCFSVPHTIYHFLNLGPYGSFDAVANVLALAATVLIPVWVLAVCRTAEPA